jgi:hypothetical protein
MPINCSWQITFHAGAVRLAKVDVKITPHMVYPTGRSNDWVKKTCQ